SGGMGLGGLAWRLGRDAEPAPHSSRATTSLGPAVWTILLINCLLSLDTVLAVAGVGQGHPVLSVVGVGISLLVLLRSGRRLSAVMERSPVLVLVEAGMLAWTGGHMSAADAVVDHTV